MSRLSPPPDRLTLDRGPDTDHVAPHMHHRLAATRHRIVPATAESCVYVLLALVLLWPATRSLRTTIAGSGDAQYYLWQGWRLGQLMRHGTIFPVHIPDVVVPYGANLLLNDGYLPSWLLGAANVLTGPFLAYNLVLIGAVVTNAFAARALAATVTSSRAIAIVAGLAFAAAPCVAMRLSIHVTLSFAFSAPLLIREALVTSREGRVRPLRLAVFLVLAFVSSIYYFLFGAIAYGAVTLASLGRSVFKAALLRRWATTLGLTLVCLAPFVTARLQLDAAEARAGAIPVGVSEAFSYSPDLLSIITQPAGSRVPVPGMGQLRSHFLERDLEGVVFPGFLLLAGTAAIPLLDPRLRRPVGIAIGTMIVLSLGPSLVVLGHAQADSSGRPLEFMPFRALLAVPGLGELRTPGRASFVLAAVLVIPLAAGLERLRERARRSLLKGAALSLATAGLLVAALPPTVAATTLGTTAETNSALETIDRTAVRGDTLLMVPADCDSDLIDDVRLQMIHRTPMVGCQTDSSAIPWYSRLQLYADSAALAALRCDPSRVGRRLTSFTRRPSLDEAGIRDLRKSLGVRFVVVDMLDIRSFRACSAVSSEVPLLRSHRILGEDGRWVVIDLS